MKKGLMILGTSIVLGILLFVCFHKSNIQTTNYVTSIEFNNQISIMGNGANAKNKTVTITGGGIYTLTGTSSDNNIVVDAKGQDVTLLFNNLNLTSTDTAPIYIKKAKTVTITLVENTENFLTDASTYQETDQNEINAIIHSKSDLIINGSGILNINANYNNGINGKDNVEITDTTIHITAKNNGIKAKDSIKIENATIDIEATGNGIKAYNETDKNSGTMELIDSNIQIDSEEDGLEAITSIIIQDGTYEIYTGGGSENASTKNTWGKWGNNEDTEASAKGIKADGTITIKSGSITIDSSDDSIHGNMNISIENGDFTLSSGDDGIHADDTLTIENGEIKVEKSYEGLEATNIYLNGGNVHINANDDGINAAGGNDGSSFERPGANNFASDNSKIEISGGYYVVHADGDGIDSNGDITMTDGTLIIEGPTDNGNGAIDYNGTYNMNGGTLIAVGSSGMAEAPSNSSTQNTIKLSFENQNKNSTIQVTNDENQVLLTFSPSKSYSSLVYSSSSLIQNQNYTISFVENNEENIDGVISASKEAKIGTILTTLTLTNKITTYGNNTMGNFGKGEMGEIPNRPPRNR